MFAAVWPLVLKFLPIGITLAEELFQGQGRGAEKLPAAVSIIKMLVDQVLPGGSLHLDNPAVQAALIAHINTGVGLWRAAEAAGLEASSAQIATQPAPSLTALAIAVQGAAVARVDPFRGGAR